MKLKIISNNAQVEVLKLSCVAWT